MPTKAQYTLVIYRTGDSASQAFAGTYAHSRGIPSGNVVGIPCSSTEILADYATFQTEVENPVVEAAEEIEARYLLLCPGVPGGFTGVGEAIISSTSRLSDLGRAYSGVAQNPLFDRRNAGTPDWDDLLENPVCARIDGPSVLFTTLLMSATDWVRRVGRVYGKLLYVPRGATSSAAYDADAEAFKDTVLPKTGLESPWASLPGTTLPEATGDAFVWSTTASEGAAWFFRRAQTPRVFFNNEYPMASPTIRSSSSRAWPAVALQSGYPCAAAMLGSTDVANYLRPAAFFRCLLAGGTIGEAFLTGSPTLNTSLTLFGDPLLTVKFPADAPSSTSLVPDAAAAAVIDRVGQAVAVLSRREAIMREIVTEVHATHDVSAILEVMVPAHEAADAYKSSHARDLASIMPLTLTITGANRAPTGEEVAAAASRTSTPVSIALAEALAMVGIAVPAASQAAKGMWMASMPIQSPAGGGPLHFQLVVSSNSDLSSPILSTSTQTSVSGWDYMSEPGKFSALPSSGVPASHVGQPVRFKASGELLQPSGGRLYYRITQIDASAGQIVNAIRSVVVPS